MTNLTNITENVTNMISAPPVTTPQSLSAWETVQQIFHKGYNGFLGLSDYSRRYISYEVLLLVFMIAVIMVIILWKLKRR